MTHLRENRQSLINFIGYNVIVNTDHSNTREGKDNHDRAICYFNNRRSHLLT